VQIISNSNDKGKDTYSSYFGQVGDWRDTIPALSGSTIVRYKLDKFKGEIIMHCHFLFHEDMGMMASFYSGDASACSYPDKCIASSSGFIGIGKVFILLFAFLILLL